MGLTPRLLFSPCTRPIYFFATESRALFSNPVKYRTVPKTTNANWERLCKVIEHSGLSVNAFARAIGLSCGETLYQIRRGNNGISPSVAKRIHEKYPDFSLAWLMFGCGESLSEVSGSGPDSVARIPVYRTLPERLFRGEPDDFLILSAASAAGAEFAVPYADDLLNPFLRNSLLLLRQQKGAILYGNIHLVETGHFRLFRILQPAPDLSVRLTVLPGTALPGSALPGATLPGSALSEASLPGSALSGSAGLTGHVPAENPFADIVVPRSSIVSLWLVCGAVCDLCR